MSEMGLLALFYINYERAPLSYKRSFREKTRIGAFGGVARATAPLAPVIDITYRQTRPD